MDSLPADAAENFGNLVHPGQVMLFHSPSLMGCTLTGFVKRAIATVSLGPVTVTSGSTAGWGLYSVAMNAAFTGSG